MAGQRGSNHTVGNLRIGFRVNSDAPLSPLNLVRGTTFRFQFVIQEELNFWDRTISKNVEKVEILVGGVTRPN